MDYSGKELFFGTDDLIVSKTDLKGKITYANDVFLNIAGYQDEEVFGKPHNLIRHPNMPRAVFELLWQTIAKGDEIFAYVVNSAKNGDYYWVIAHVTPSFSDGKIVGYHSTRRVPNPNIIKNNIEPLYDKLNSVEQASSSKKEGLGNSMQAIQDQLREQGQSYNEFISDLMREA